jgi:hypothetical protein
MKNMKKLKSLFPDDFFWIIRLILLMNKYHKIINELLAIKEEPKQNNKASYEFLQRDLIN